MKNIMLIATGGTIACEETESGLAPRLDAERLISFIPDIAKICCLDAVSLLNIDSSDMTPLLMGKIADCIAENYDKYDGFVVTHGTDTLGYTAAALSLMLFNLRKPVILTGSQLPIENPHTDAKRNLLDAVRFACSDFSGVFVAFCGKLIDGAHAVKMKTRSFDAFDSVNAPEAAALEALPHAAATENDGHNDTQSTVCPRPANQMSDDGKMYADTRLCTDIMLIRVFPAMRTDIFDHILQSGYRGVIVEAFGLGGLPSHDSDITEKLSLLTHAGISVVIKTQCLLEGTDPNVYQVGQFAKKGDIINAGSMTTEFTVMKLMWALAHFNKNDDIKKFMEEV